MPFFISDLGPARFAALAALVFFAGVVDALAGGGGIITLPAYLSLGVNPAFILGTNKLASSIGTVASTVNYHIGRKLRLGPFLPALAASLAGSFFGARAAGRLDPRWLKYMLLAVIPVVAAFLYSRHRFGHDDRSADFSALELAWRSALIAFPLGCYDGFFGPGAGTFLALAFSRFCRYDLLSATARAKILNLVSNVSALAAFLLAGKVILALGLAMGIMSLCGHWAGSHLGLRNGARLIRPMVLTVCAGLFLKLLLDARG